MQAQMLMSIEFVATSEQFQHFVRSTFISAAPACSVIATCSWKEFSLAAFVTA
jgi:hypothetical protein